MSKLATEKKYTTISIPTTLYERLEAHIDGTDFRSVTEFLVFLARANTTKVIAP